VYKTQRLYLKAEASGNKALAQKLRVMLKEMEEKTEVDSVTENEYNYSRKSPNLLTKSNIRKRPAQRTCYALGL